MVISRSLMNFYEDLAKAKGKESWKELLNIDGKVISDADNFNDREKIHLINSFNNPIYFIDKIKLNNTSSAVRPSNIERIDFNIGTYLAVRNLMAGKSVVLALPPQTKKSLTIKAYALYLLLFNEGYIVVANNRVLSTLRECQKSIISLYDDLPEYLKIKSKKDISDRIISDTKKDEEQYVGKIMLCIYDDLNERQVGRVKLNLAYPVVICDRLYADELWKDKIQTEITKSGASNVIGVKYNAFDLGLMTTDTAADKLQQHNFDLSTFLKEYVL